MKMFDEEKEHLEETLKAIDEEIDKNKIKISKLEASSRGLSFEDRQRGTHFQLNSKLNDVDKIVDSLIKARPVPYFGRIDVSYNGDEQQSIYIGRVGISSDNDAIVTDWRAPICSLYYDSEIGKTEYEANGNKYEIDLDLKRQINIKDSKLIDVQDASLEA